MASLALACGELVGIDQYSVVEAPSPDGHGGFAFAREACGACMVQGCGAELEACRNNGMCNAWLQCAAACEDGACEFRCYKSVGHTNPVTAAVVECQQRSCTPVACEGTWGANMGEGVADCARASPCAGLISACAADQKCRETLSCLAANDCLIRSDPGCIWTCFDAHDAYTPGSVFMQTALCVWQSCGNNIDHDLSCSEGEGYRWPAPTSGTISAEVLVHLSPLPESFGPGAPGEDEGPIPGLHIRACRANNHACTSPDAEARTNEHGVALLQLSTFGVGWEGYFRLTMSDETCQQDFLHYVGRPLTRDTKLSVPVPLRWKEFRCGGGTTGIPWEDGKSRLFTFPRDCRNNPFPLGEVIIEAVGGGGQPIVGFPALENVDPGLRSILAIWNDEFVAQASNILLEPNTYTRLNWLYPLPAP